MSQTALCRAFCELFRAAPSEAAAMLLGVIVASFSSAKVWIEFSQVSAQSQTALSKKDVPAFWTGRRDMFFVLLKLVAASVVEDFCSGMLCLRWREILTGNLLRRYFNVKDRIPETVKKSTNEPHPVEPPIADGATLSDNAARAISSDGRESEVVSSTDEAQQTFPYYDIKLRPDGIANPDQRIADDVHASVHDVVNLMRSLISNTVSFIGFSRILYRISPNVLNGLFAYAAFGTLVTVTCFSKKLTEATHNVRTREAYLRAALLRVNDSAESIAFHNAGCFELHRLKVTLALLMHTMHTRMKWSISESCFQRLYSWITLILPSMIMAPAYFRGEIEFGAISQTFMAFSSVKQLLMFIANNMGTLTALKAKAQRLESLNTMLKQVNDRGKEKPKFETSVSGPPGGEEEDRITLHALEYKQPMYLLTMKDLVIRVPYKVDDHRLGTIGGDRQSSKLEVIPHDTIMIQGPSGIGKSAVLRVIAGLWTEGKGEITRTNRVFFLPQCPYLPPGAESGLSSLRDQLCFPYVGEDQKRFSTSALVDVLLISELDKFLIRSDDGVVDPEIGLNKTLDWSITLSGGERQRLVFARLLLQIQEYEHGEGCLVLLDEATSSCDEVMESVLYDALLRRLTRGALLSVGHRKSLLRFHKKLCTME